jgi:3-hydroxybutyryl-CoA dehydrogenase
MAAASSTDLAVEAATENPELKFKIFKELDAAAAPGALLASNTSSISITKLAAATRRPDRVIGMHFMNPVPLMKLVEVIRGLGTSDETTQTILALCRTMGKSRWRPTIPRVSFRTASCTMIVSSLCAAGNVGTARPSTR